MSTTLQVIRRLALGALKVRGLAPPCRTLRIGRITLLPHQIAAIDWLHPRLARYGGALLADPPGIGKTYVALAIAANSNVTPLVIAPAALRERWYAAADETGVRIQFVSTERLSAPSDPQIAPRQLVIIDEAHHLRTRSTRRYHRTTAICASATVLLLSATPIQNALHDLTHITNLFHLPPSRQSIAHLRRRLTLRRTLDQLLAADQSALEGYAIPTVRSVATPALAIQHPALPARLLSLPQVRSDSNEGHALLQLGLLHALRSSDAAAQERIYRRIAATVAMEHATEAGVEPTPSIRRAFHSTSGTVQLAMAQLLGPTNATLGAPMLAGARDQRRALQELLPFLTGIGDRQRSRVLRRLARWCQHPVVAFTQFGATATALFQQLHRETGIALLTGSGARIASGVISRAEVLDRLLSLRYRSRHNAVRLLITTDVLSEGLSLAGVATVVHLDLPWTAARLDQRVGRAARIGAPVAQVRVMRLTAPLPVPAEQAIHDLLVAKRRHMRRVDGGDDASLVTALAELCTLHPRANDHRRWLTLRSPLRRTPITLAIVRVRRDRLLVVLDGGSLRAPATQDWQALHCGRVTDARPGAIAALKRALTTWQFDRDMSSMVDKPSDQRLRSRQLADEHLLCVSRAQRASRANAVTLHRRTAMDSDHDVAAGELQEFVADGASDPGPSGAAPVRRSRAASSDHDLRVRVLCGVQMIPAGA